MNADRRSPRGPAPHPVHAFTLIELLVVVAIIAVLIAILLPAIGGVRRSARQAATQALVNDFGTAAVRFSNDNNDRMPGFFSEEQMGAEQNLTRGFTAAENAMLDLAGENAVFGVGQTRPANAPTTAVQVGPISDTRRMAWVDPKLLGTSRNAYFTPSSENYKEMLMGTQQLGSGPSLPDLIDAFGNPLLVWSQDQAARGSINPSANNPDPFGQFVAEHSTGANNLAWFYLASNAGFLRSNSLGQGGQNQAGPIASGVTSSIGPGVPLENRRITLASLLASPSYSLTAPGQTIQTAQFDRIYPARPRGRFIVQSAGSNGLYFGTDERGWGSNAVNNRIYFGNSFKSSSGQRFEAESGGGFTNIDLLEGFDDVINAVGG